jgi:hypothetical protein
MAEGPGRCEQQHSLLSGVGIDLPWVDLSGLHCSNQEDEQIQVEQ